MISSLGHRQGRAILYEEIIQLENADGGVLKACAILLGPTEKAMTTLKKHSG